VDGRFALSDDSHGPKFVGLNYDRIPSYLLSTGVTELWYLRYSELSNSSGRNIQAVKFDGDWLAHDFWKKRLENE